MIYILKRENRRKNTPVEQLFTEGGKVLLQLKAVHVEWDVISHITVKPAVRICSIHKTVKSNLIIMFLDVAKSWVGWQGRRTLFTNHLMTRSTLSIYKKANIHMRSQDVGIFISQDAIFPLFLVLLHLSYWKRWPKWVNCPKLVIQKYIFLIIITFNLNFQICFALLRKH